MNKWLIVFTVIAIPLIFLAFVFTGCGKVVEEGGTTTTTTSAGGTTTTSVSGGTTTTYLLIKYPAESCTAIQNDPDTVYNSNVLLLIGWDGMGSNEAFIKFDVSTLPALTVIKSAILKIYIEAASTSTTNIDFYNLDNNWSQTSLTWNNKPGITGARIARKTVNLLSDIGTTANIDITPLVQAWVTSSGYANFGIGIINVDAATLNLVSIGSGVPASTHKPILEIRY